MHDHDAVLTFAEFLAHTASSHCLKQTRELVASKIELEDELGEVSALLDEAFATLRQKLITRIENAPSDYTRMVRRIAHLRRAPSRPWQELPVRVAAQYMFKRQLRDFISGPGGPKKTRASVHARALAQVFQCASSPGFEQSSLVHAELTPFGDSCSQSSSTTRLETHSDSVTSPAIDVETSKSSSQAEETCASALAFLAQNPPVYGSEERSSESLYQSAKSTYEKFQALTVRTVSHAGEPMLTDCLRA